MLTSEIYDLKKGDFIYKKSVRKFYKLHVLHVHYENEQFISVLIKFWVSSKKYWRYEFADFHQLFYRCLKNERSIVDTDN